MSLHESLLGNIGHNYKGVLNPGIFIHLWWAFASSLVLFCSLCILSFFDAGFTSHRVPPVCLSDGASIKCVSCMYLGDTYVLLVYMPPNLNYVPAKPVYLPERRCS